MFFGCSPFPAAITTRTSFFIWISTYNRLLCPWCFWRYWVSGFHIPTSDIYIQGGHLLVINVVKYQDIPGPWVVNTPRPKTTSRTCRHKTSVDVFFSNSSLAFFCVQKIHHLFNESLEFWTQPSHAVSAITWWILNLWETVFFLPKVSQKSWETAVGFSFLLATYMD